ncbi:hypothetical protein HK101_005749, partial [Irineochytrium annulatum]
SVDDADEVRAGSVGSVAVANDDGVIGSGDGMRDDIVEVGEKVGERVVDGEDGIVDARGENVVAVNVAVEVDEVVSVKVDESR